MRTVLLVMRCDYGTFIALPTPEAEARRIVIEWGEGKSPKKLNGVDVMGRYWSVDTEKVVLLHTEEIQDQQGTQTKPVQQGTFPMPGNWKGSGL